MVRDGYFYGFALLAAAAIPGWLAAPAWAIIPAAFAAFFFWFFRDPERSIPQEVGAVVSPGDGKVTDISRILVKDVPYSRISIFLSVFDVHVNRSPIAGLIRQVEYKPGRFLNAMNPASAAENEQNIVTVEGDGQIVIFKQIAGLIARRIVFTKHIGERVQRGERIGLIKFGSRVDVLLPIGAELKIKTGDRVRGGASVLAVLAPHNSQERTTNLAHAGAQQNQGGR